MLILCCGPDTFRAQQRAQELEVAFRRKHDQQGLSIERLSSGKEGLAQLIERINTVSLFNPRRLLRLSDALADCSKTQLAALARALQRDPEHVIVISQEAEPPASAILQAFAPECRIIKDEFPIQSGQAFLSWLREQAKAMHVVDDAAVLSLAQAADGDSWLAWNELMKLAAGGRSDLVAAGVDKTIFEYAESYLRNESRRWDVLYDQTVRTQALTTFLSQARAALRVRDGATAGLHPFLVKKLKLKKCHDAEAALAATIQALLVQRSGHAGEIEALTLLR